MKFTVVHEAGLCIGCGSCVAVCPKFWEMGADNKSHLIGSEEDVQESGGNKVASQVLEIEESDKECNQNAADVCPVNCISVKPTCP